MPSAGLSWAVRDDDLAALLLREAWGYFDPKAGNWRPAGVTDRDREGSPVSTAATGFGLTALTVAAERGWLPERAASERAAGVLRTLAGSPGAAIRGIYYHFLTGDGARTWRSEASSIDTALLAAGAALAAARFPECRQAADDLAGAADWDWLRRGGEGRELIGHGYRPGKGHLRWRWEGYSEGLLLQIVAAGTGKLSDAQYAAWRATYRPAADHDHPHLACGPLFCHQFPHCFADLRGRPDAWGGYAEEATNATRAHRAYCAENPRGHVGYAADAFGLSATDGPTSGRRRDALGRLTRFHAYKARGIEPGDADDGTLCPSATAASLPFCPDAVLPALRTFHERGVGLRSYNDTFPEGWVQPDRLAVEYGPALLMIENHLTGLPWELSRSAPLIGRGLDRCGFRPRPA